MSAPENTPAVDAAAISQDVASVDSQPIGSGKATDLRLQRIEQFQAEALAKADSLAANLGAANGALMRIGYRLEGAIEGAVDRPLFTLERFEEVSPAIDMYLRVLREVDRLAQLDQRIGTSRYGRGQAKAG